MGTNTEVREHSITAFGLENCFRGSISALSGRFFSGRRQRLVTLVTGSRRFAIYTTRFVKNLESSGKPPLRLRWKNAWFVSRGVRR